MNYLKKIFKAPAFYVALLSILVCTLAVYKLKLIGIIPSKYILIITISFSLLFILGIVLICLKRFRAKCIGAVILLITHFAVFWITYQSSGVANFFKNQSPIMTAEASDSMEIVTLKNSPYNDIKNIDSKEILVNSKTDENDTNILKHKLEQDHKLNVKYKEAKSYIESAYNLLNNKDQIIALNTRYKSLINEKYPSFDKKTKVIYSYPLKGQQEKVILKKMNSIATTPFNLYISGNDSFGNLVEGGRSDVNIIATVNPKTSKVLLTSVPRDMYVKIPTVGNVYDKLTHVSTLGINASIKSIEDLLGINISHYIMINFSSLIKIVDTIGGIEVDNPQAFNTFDISEMPFSFNRGRIKLNGLQALAFSRERHFFGDEKKRGENQERVIKGILEKITKPNNIINFGTILSKIGQVYSTSFTNEEISELVKDQLDTNRKWTVQSFNLNGQGITGPYSYMMPNDKLYFMLPFEQTTNYSKQLIENTLKGRDYIIDRSYYEPMDTSLLYDVNGR